MAQLPADRTKLAVAQANQTPGLVASANANINAMTEAYDTIDLLNGKVDAHAQASTLPHPDGSVTTAKIANGAVSAAKLGAGAVTSDKIADSSVTTEKVATSAVSEPKLANASVSRRTLVNGAVGADQLDPALLQQYGTAATNAKFQTIDAQLADIAINVKYMPAPYVSARGDGTTNDAAALNAAFANFSRVFIPEGNYKLDSSITILNSYKVRHIQGVSMKDSLLSFSGTDGIVNYKSGIIIEDIGLMGTGGVGSGIKMLSSVRMRSCQIYSFSIGIDLTQGVNIISAFFDRVTVAYNASYGVKVVSGGTSQNNQITFRELYIVKNGPDADNLTSNATIGTGDGMYISGGYSILIANCVFEYNTGVGLRLDPINYPLYGVTVTSPYFERNKYGQLYIDNTSSPYTITGLSVFGDFYTDAGISPVTNSLTNRQMYVTRPDRALNTPNSNFFGNIGFAERNMLTRRHNMLNAFPINRMSDLAVDYPNNIVTYSSETVFQITNTVSGQMFTTELMYIDPIYDYIFSYDVIKVNSSASPNLLAYLYDNDSGALISTAAACYLGGGAFGWKTVSARITGLSATRVLRLYFNIEGTKPSDLQIYAKNIRLMPVIKNTALPTNTTANRPTSGLVSGMQFFDTTLNKPIWYNGSNWVDAAGTTV